MDKTMAGLLGAMGALAATTPSHAASRPAMDMEQAMTATSYADLLRPIPNAASLLKEAADHQNGAAAEGEGSIDRNMIETVQYHDQTPVYHDHHHHHHHYIRRHHHRRVVVAVPVPAPHHHHHHHDSTVVIAPRGI